MQSQIGNTPLVSVIIPVYNRNELLQRAINSVLKQTYRQFELLIIDDGSSIDISIPKDPRVYYIYQQHKGVSSARNLGIILSSGDFIAFLDSDDEWYRKKLAICIDHFKAHPECNILHTNEKWIKNGHFINEKKKHKKTGGDIFKRSLDLCLVSPSTVIMRGSVFKKYGLFRTDLPVAEDYDLWLRIAAREQFCYIDRRLTIKYGGHDDQLSKIWGLDRFRIQSLRGLLYNSNITPSQKQWIKNTIIKKSKILINGAKKRHRYFFALKYYFHILQTKKCFIKKFKKI